MIRSALLLCAILLAVLCFGCGPAFTPPPYQPTVARATGIYPIPITVLQNPSVDCTSADSFASSVLLIDPNFDPTVHAPNYQPPTGSSINNSFIHADLANAYTNAPQFLKDELCKLKGIFITQGQWSWGFRENPNQVPGCPATNSCSAYIALTYKLWNNGTTYAFAFHDYENSIVLSLLSGVSGPQYVYANPDTSATTVLAVLAHEMGHILWWKRDVANFNCQTPPPGSQRMFYRMSWQRVTGTPQFHHFGEQQHPNPGGSGGNIPVGNIDKDQVLSDIVSDDYDTVTQDLQYVYGGEWASLFATVSPDEDFVETFVLRSLTAPPANMQSLLVSIPYTPAVDVIAQLLNNTFTNLHKKANWLQVCLGY